MVKEIYTLINSHLHNIDYFTKRGILSTKNDKAFVIQNYLLDFKGDEMIYYNSYSIYKIEGGILDEDILHHTEYLNTLKFRGLPNYELD